MRVATSASSHSPRGTGGATSGAATIGTRAAFMKPECYEIIRYICTYLIVSRNPVQLRYCNPHLQHLGFLIPPYGHLENSPRMRLVVLCVPHGPAVGHLALDGAGRVG